MYHWEEDRALTNRERARLQTFPDEFVFEGGNSSVRKPSWNGNSPLGAQIILMLSLKVSPLYHMTVLKSLTYWIMGFKDFNII